MEKSNFFDFHSCPRYPLEMHVVYFKAKYIYYEEAAKYEDGVIFEVHFFYIQEDINDSLSPLIEKLSDVHRSGTSVDVEEFALARYVTVFVSDYFLYCGTIMCGKDRHRVTWIISRHASGISNSQMNEFRQLSGQDGFPLIRYNHKIYKIGNRKIYHVNGSDYFKEILYPCPKISHKKTEKLCIRFHFKPPNKVKKPTYNEQNKRKDGMEKNTYLGKTEAPARNKKMICDKNKIINWGEKRYVEPVLGRRNIIDSVVQWLRNSVVQNREEFTSLFETTEVEKEESSIEKDLVSRATSSKKISSSATEVKNNICETIKDKIGWPYDDYSIEFTPSAETIPFKSVDSNPQDGPVKENVNVGIMKKKIHRKNKVNLFSDLESNFTQQVMNRSKIQNDGGRVTNVHENFSLYTKSMDTIKKKITEINSNQFVNSEGSKKETRQGMKLKESIDRPRSSETFAKSIIAGFKNMYLKYKNDFDNRDYSNIINKSKLLKTINKEDKVRRTKKKELSKDFSHKIINNDYRSVRKKKNHFKIEKSDVKIAMENDSEYSYSQSSITSISDCDEVGNNVTCRKLCHIQQKEKKRKRRSNDEKLTKKRDILTPLKVDLDFLPDNFKDINDVNKRKQQLRRKNGQQLNKPDIICNDSIRRKHKRTQTFKISKSSSSGSKNIYSSKKRVVFGRSSDISVEKKVKFKNRVKKREVFGRSSDTSTEKKVKLKNRVKKCEVFGRSSDTSVEKKGKFKNRIKKYSGHRTYTQYKKGAENDFKCSENKEKHTFGNVKIKQTSSHESVYIFIKKAIDDDRTDVNEDTKKKPGILHEWLLSAKDLITGPKS